MKEYRMMRLIAFYYKYLLVVTIISTYFFWFDASAASLMLVIVILALPYLIHTFLFRDKTLEKKVADGKLPGCPFEYLIAATVIAPGIVLSEERVNSLFCCFLYLLALGIFFFNKYYRGKYTLLYRNPSVTENTRKRAENKLRKSFLKLLSVSV
ncbi:MAG: hypothetical protein J1F22_09300, partial [Lachnospiraceae bacterium]|nr:hypothetical protein [Lachnospiraceae bacterium]